GVILAVLARRPIAILAGLLLPTLVSVAMLGMGYERRLTYCVEWAAVALAVVGLCRGLDAIEGVPSPAHGFGRDGSWGRAGRAVVIGFVAGERIAHWCPLFAGRPYAFTIFDTEPELMDGFVVSPGALPPGAIEGELILVAAPVVRENCGSSLEVVAMGVAPTG